MNRAYARELLSSFLNERNLTGLSHLLVESARDNLNIGGRLDEALAAFRRSPSASNYQRVAELMVEYQDSVNQRLAIETHYDRARRGEWPEDILALAAGSAAEVIDELNKWPRGGAR